MTEKPYAPSSRRIPELDGLRVTLVFIVAIVQLLQGLGNLAARKIDHRK